MSEKEKPMRPLVISAGEYSYYGLEGIFMVEEAVVDAFNTLWNECIEAEEAIKYPTDLEPNEHSDWLNGKRKSKLTEHYASQKRQKKETHERLEAFLLDALESIEPADFYEYTHPEIGPFGKDSFIGKLGLVAEDDE